MKLNCNLRKTRLERAYTQKDMARIIDVSVRTWQTYETGTRTPTLENLIKIADFLNVSLDELVGRKFPKD